MSENQKQMITVPIREEYHSFMEGNVDYLIDTLTRIKNEYTNQYSHLRYELNSHDFFVLYGDRLETDAEYNSRLEANRLIREKKEKVKKQKLQRDLERKKSKERKLKEIKRIFNIDENVNVEELRNKLSGALSLLEEH